MLTSAKLNLRFKKVIFLTD